MSDQLDTNDVTTVLESVSERQVTNIRSTGLSQIQIHFEIGRHDANGLPVESGRYALEVSLDGNNLWFHDYDGETETLWENKTRR